jgi:hypothetical protein
VQVAGERMDEAARKLQRSGGCCLVARNKEEKKKTKKKQQNWGIGRLMNENIDLRRVRSADRSGRADGTMGAEGGRGGGDGGQCLWIGD